MTALPARSIPYRTLIAWSVVYLGTLVAGSELVGPKPAIIALGLPVLAAGALYAVVRPAVTVALMVVTEVVNLSGVAAEHIRLPVFPAILALGVLSLALALRDPAQRARLNRGTAVCIGFVACYLLAELLSVLGSADTTETKAALKPSLAEFAFLITVFLLIQLSGRHWVVAAAFVIPLAVLSMLTLVNEVVFNGTQPFGGFASVTEASGRLVTTLRYGGPLTDSNFWGRHLILGLPLAGALIVRAVKSDRNRAAVGWGVALLVLLVGVYLTQSRGSLIAAGLVVVVWVLASGPTARRWGLMSLPIGTLLLFLPGVGNRLVDLVGDVAQAGSNYSVDQSVLGRLAAQEIAWKMFQERPIFGFGTGVYRVVVPQYADRVPTAVETPTDAAHNLYAQLAAESGIVGLIGWTVFVGGFAVAVAIRLTRTSPAVAPAERSLAAALLAGIVGWSFASIFLHLAYFRTFGIILALAGAVATAARPEIDFAVQTRPSRVRETALALGVGAAATALVLVLAPTRTDTTASQRVAIVPTGQMGGYYAYALDIRTREPVLPTFAAMMARGDKDVSAVADPVRGLIKLAVTAADPEAATARLKTAVAQARINLKDLRVDSWYHVVAVGDVQLTTHNNRTAGWTLAAVGAGVAAAMTATVIARRSIRLPRHRRAFGVFRDSVN